jgi:serine/threonine protein kinase
MLSGETQFHPMYSAQPAQPAAPPARVAPLYRIGRLLGRGSFGDIYQGFSADSGAEVAIKVACLFVCSLRRVCFCVRCSMSNPVVVQESKSCSHPQLKYEAKVLTCLSDLRTSELGAVFASVFVRLFVERC